MKEITSLGRRRGVSFTDTFCCIIFSVAIIGLVPISFYAFRYGDIKRIINNYDCYGNVCGRKHNVKLKNVTFSGRSTENHPFVFHFNPFAWISGKRICVETCPDERISTPQELKNYTARTGNLLCDFTVSKADYNDLNKLKRAIDRHACPELPIKRHFLFLGFCVESFIHRKTANQNASSNSKSNQLSAATKKLTDKVLEQSGVKLFNMKRKNILGGINRLKPAIDNVLRDFILSWRELIFLMVASLVISLLIIFLLRFLASLVVYVLLVLTVLATLALNAFLWLVYAINIDLLGAQLSANVQHLRSDFIQAESFLYLAVAVSVATLLLYLVIGVMWKRVRLVIKLFGSAARCLAQVPSLLLQPLLTFIPIAAFIAFWLVMLGYLLSVQTELFVNSSSPSSSPSPPSSNIFSSGSSSSASSNSLGVARRLAKSAFSLIDSSPDCVNFAMASYPKWIWIYNIFMFFWIIEYFIQSQQLVIAGAVAEWYFNDKKSVPNCILLSSFGRAVFQHSGSVAFGSLIINLVRLPRYLIIYCQKKLCKDSANSSSSSAGGGLGDVALLPDITKCCCSCSCAKCAACSCVCCLKCVERCLKFLNKNAYAIIAIEGRNFCSAAQRVFLLLLKNSLRVAALNSVGDFILFLGKVCVSALTTVLSVYVLMARQDLYCYPVPVAFVCLASYMIAHCVISIYETILDVQLICFCVFEERKAAAEEREAAGGGDEADAALAGGERGGGGERNEEFKRSLMEASEKYNALTHTPSSSAANQDEKIELKSQEKN